MAERVRDPVCGMMVDKSHAVTFEKDGWTVYFCSEHCRSQYQAPGAPALAQAAQAAPAEEERLVAHAAHGPHAGGHAGHHAHMVADFQKRFWISLVLTVPIVILSPTIGPTGQFPARGLLLFLFSTVIFFYGGRPFLQGSVQELRDRLPGMMTLIAVAITVAYVYSVLVLAHAPGQVFFWELATLIDIMLLGHWIEMRSVMGASKALEDLAKLLPNEAHLIRPDGSVADVPLAELRAGQTVLIRPGERIPADGSIVDGESEIDESMLTGESRLVAKKEGDQVIGGSVNGTGSLMTQATRTGAESYLAQVVKLVEQAGASKSRAQGLADRAAFALTIIALVGGFITLGVWLGLGQGPAFAMERMVTVMVITCPHALGLAVPLVVAMITAISARNGLLIRQRTPFENARRVDTVVFDKTGTLTKGEFGVSDVVSFGDWGEEKLLRQAASVEQNSEHTIARGIVRQAEEAGLRPAPISNFASLPGRGAKATVDEEEVLVGSMRILATAGIREREMAARVDPIAAQGKTIVLVISGGKVQGLIALADLLRDESQEAVRMLKDRGMEVAMITGDNEPTARYVAERLGLNTYFAEVLPDQKSEKIRELQRLGKKVAMVGDGVNDAPALAQADVGIAIGAGTEVAIETADVILVENDPRDVADVIALSRLTNRKMVQNLLWATGYNVVAIPLAAGVLYHYGVVLPPAVGAIVMSLSTIIVAVNARRISYRKKGRGADAGSPVREIVSEAPVGPAR
ncbi:MAG: copper-translocating P-type ATPase [Planctomycetes bacterium]|nr:copper-translocating P-type ATPase [Planctomycetota bacterium]